MDKVEAPEKTTTSDDSLVASDTLAETSALTVAEGRHAHDAREFGKRFLESGPAGFEPAFRAVVLGVGVLGGVTLEGAGILLVLGGHSRKRQHLLVERQDAGALGDEIAVVEVIGFDLMGDTSRYVGPPAHGLLNTSAKNGKVRSVSKLRHATAALLVNLLLDLSLPLRVVKHSEKEVV